MLKDRPGLSLAMKSLKSDIFKDVQITEGCQNFHFQFFLRDVKLDDLDSNLQCST